MFRKIKTKIFLVILVLSILPTSLLGAYFYKVSRDLNIEQTNAIYRHNLETYSIGLDVLFESIKNDTTAIIADSLVASNSPSVPQILAEPIPAQSQPYYYFLKLQKLSAKTHSLINDKLNIVGITYYDTYNFAYPILFDQGELMPGNPIVSGQWKTKRWMSTWKEAIWNAGGKDVIFSMNMSHPKEASLFSFGKRVIDAGNFSSSGLMLVHVRRDFLKNLFPKTSGMGNSGYVVVDASNPKKIYSICSIGSIVNESNIIEQYYAGTLDSNSSHLVDVIHNKTTGWDILSILSREEVIKSATVIKTTIATSTVIAVLVLLFLNLILTNILSRPLDTLRRAILGVASGKHMVIEESFTNDEIGQIGTEFKTLVEENLLLKDQLYLSTIKTKDAQLHALQAQINPHFLYNALDTIYWSANMDGAQNAADMSIALSKLFKTFLGNQDGLTTVQEELDIVDNYLLIQKMRFQDKITYHVDVSKEVREAPILRLLLQPLVENGIIHGLEPKVGTGNLHLIGRMLSNDTILFVIQDDGVGMESLEEIQAGRGILNVQERIQLYYGEDYSVEYQSAPNQGTTLFLQIPIDPGYYKSIPLSLDKKEAEPL